jgi:4-oxalocrotonate tautomerase
MASRWIGSNTSPTRSTEDADAMPHVIVKLWPGKSEQQKRRLAQAITDDVMKVLQYGEESVSVAFEEVDANDWADRVYQPDIVRKADTLYKKPGYTM